MSKNELVYERQSVPAPKIVVPGPDGYYEINAGAYGITNENGVMYSTEGIEKVFDNDSLLTRRIQKGVVFSELGHPEYVPGMSLAMFEARNKRIQEDRCCGHIRKAALLKNKDNSTYITRIWVKPQGEKYIALEQGLQNPYSNCFFSVRSCSNRTRINGVLVKTVYEVNNWDYVIEGGIGIANKFDTEASGISMDLEDMSGDSINEIIRNEELFAIDLNDTREVKHVLKHFDEFKKSNHLDLEAIDSISSVEGILRRAVTSNTGNDIFSWK